MMVRMETHVQFQGSMGCLDSIDQVLQLQLFAQFTLYVSIKAVGTNRSIGGVRYDGIRYLPIFWAVIR